MFYNIAHIVVGILWRLWFRLEFYGLENVPKEGGFIFCCNHISGLDPTIVCLGVPRKYKLRFMGKAELFEVTFLKHILLPKAGCWVFSPRAPVPPMSAFCGLSPAFL